MKKETLNEEQLKQAAKEMGGFDYPIYKVGTTKTCEKDEKHPDGTKYVVAYVESERFVDARTFALRLFGVPEVDIHLDSLSEFDKPVPRHQVRWKGHAAGADAIRMQYREITTEDADPKWLAIRHL